MIRARDQCFPRRRFREPPELLRLASHFQPALLPRCGVASARPRRQITHLLATQRQLIFRWLLRLHLREGLAVRRPQAQSLGQAQFGTIRLVTAPPSPIPPASPTAPPTAAPRAFPIPSGSASSVGTAASSFSVAWGVRILIPSFGIPRAERWAEPCSASDRDVTTAATDSKVFLGCNLRRARHYFFFVILIFGNFRLTAATTAACSGFPELVPMRPVRARRQESDIFWHFFQRSPISEVFFC